MRLAWFRPDTGHVAISTPSSTACATTHDVQLVDARAAHDFVWQAAQGAFDLCVYELDDSAAHQYIWPYLLHYPGVLALRTVSLHDGRATALVHQHRDAHRDAEMAFADGAGRTDPPWPLLRGSWSTWRVPVLASRVTAVRRRRAGRRDRARLPRRSRRRACPPASPIRGEARAMPRIGNAAPPCGSSSATTVRRGAVERAAARARQAGANLETRATCPPRTRGRCSTPT